MFHLTKPSKTKIHPIYFVLMSHNKILFYLLPIVELTLFGLREYLLSIRGLGLKSVECVRLLTLHHLAFPVRITITKNAIHSIFFYKKHLVCAQLGWHKCRTYSCTTWMGTSATTSRVSSIASSRIVSI